MIDLIGRIKRIIDSVTSIKTQTDKLAGEAPASASVSKDWLTGPDRVLCTIGADGVRYKLHSLLVDIGALTLASKVTITLTMEINNVSRTVYEQEFTQGTDPDGLWIVNGTIGIHEQIIVEVTSDTDDDVAVGYDYMLEAM